MATSEAVLRLLLDDRQAVAGIKRTESRVENLGKIALGLNRAFERASKSAREAFQLASKAARAMAAALEVAENAARNIDAVRVFEASGRSIGQYSEALGGLISQAELAKQVNLAESFGIAGDDFVRGIELARAAAIATGQSFDYMLNSFTVAASRMSKPIADNLGIMVSAEEANKRYADSLGRTAGSLTDLEKRQAFVNEMLRQGAPLIERVAKAGADSATEYDKLSASAKNLAQAFGENIDIVIKPAVAWVGKLMSMLAKFYRGEFEFDPTLFVPIKWAEIESEADSAIKVVERFREQERKALEELATIEEALARGEHKEHIEYWRSRAEDLRKTAEQAARNAATASKLLGELSKPGGDKPKPDKKPPVDDKPKPDKKPPVDDKPKPDKKPPPPVEAVDDTTAWFKEQLDKERQEKYRERQEKHREERKREERKRAWLYEAAELKRRQKEIERRQKEHLRKIAREEERHLAKMEADRKRAADKKKREMEREQAEITRREHAFYGRLVSIASNAYRQMTSVALQALEDFVAGQQVRLDAIAASVMKQAGTQTIGFGLALIAEGFANSLSSNQVVAAQSPRQYAGGAALVAAGTAMGGAGAFWAGSIRRGEGGASGGVGIEGAPQSPFGGEARQRGRDRGQVNISPGAIVLGDLSAAASGIQNAMQRGGRFLLGVG